MNPLKIIGTFIYPYGNILVKMAEPNGNGRKPVTLSIKSELLEKYTKYCQEHGMVISRRLEVLMQQDLEKISQDSQHSQS